MCQEHHEQPHGAEGSNQQPHHPTQRPARTLVLCFDGTNDSFDEDPTNIIRLFAALEKGKPTEQVVYYQPGIGTYVRPEAPWAPPIQRFARFVDKGLAWYIGTHITGGYRFLMDHYAPGDRICLFGFSRGAFTARCLAGMLHKVGLLPRSNAEQVNFAYELYTGKDNWHQALKFKDTFSTQVEVEFIGVWDTVSSVGLGAPLLAFNKSETFVRTFRHALALDERRAKFQPNPWQYNKPCDCRPQQSPGDNIVDSHKSDHAACQSNKNSYCWCRDDPQFHGGMKTDVLEVWFRGFHADVGGGNDKDHIRKSLANPSLRWMVTEVLKSECGIVFKQKAFGDRMPTLMKTVDAFRGLPSSKSTSGSGHCDDTPGHQARKLGNGHCDDIDGQEAHPSALKPPETPKSTLGKSLGAPVEPSPNACPCDDIPPEASMWTKPLWWLLESVRLYRPEDLTSEPCDREHTPEEEANGALHDMLKKKPQWQLLEYVPLWQYWSEKDEHGVPQTKNWWKINRGRGRSVDQATPYFHKSVAFRRDDKWTPSISTGKEPYYVDEDKNLPEIVKRRLRMY